jgi:C4-dicarboxylate transporter
VPLRLLPVTFHDAATEVGVIAPSVRDIAGVVVAVATLHETQFAVVTETSVTVHDHPPPHPVCNVCFEIQ